MRAKILFFTICFALLVFSMAVWAQTNPPAIPVSPIATNAAPELPSSTADDIVKVFHDFGVNVSGTTVAVVLFIGANFARKYLFKDESTAMGKLMKFVTADPHTIPPPTAPPTTAVNPPTIP